MCGRFNVTDLPGLGELLTDLGVELELAGPRYNIAPTEDILLVHDGCAQSARWWLTPSWASGIDQKYSMFNARCESLATSRAFARPFSKQRGLVPMSSFIEWRTENGAKQPWLIAAEGDPLMVAALWDVWLGGEIPLLSCTLVTTAAAKSFEPWHQRMPVMLTRDECDPWLDNALEIAADDPVFRPELKFDLSLTPINKAVGNSRNKGADVLVPVGDTVLLVTS